MNNYFNSSYYINDNKIYSRSTYAETIFNGFHYDFYDINFSFNIYNNDSYQFKNWNNYSDCIRKIYPIKNFKTISLNLYHPNIKIYYNYWHFMLDELSKFYMYFELKKIIPDLKIVINLQELNDWSKEIIFDILEIKLDDIYNISYDFIQNTKLNILATPPNLNFNKFIYDNFYYKKIIKKVCDINNSGKYLKKCFNLRFNIKRKNNRNIINYNKIKKLLSKYNYHPFDNLKLSVRESIKHFYNLEYLIIDNGAGLTNLLWCNKDVKIIFINGPHFSKCMHYFYRTHEYPSNNKIEVISKEGENHNNDWLFDDKMKKELVAALDKQVIEKIKLIENELSILKKIIS